MKGEVFWDVIPNRPVKCYRRSKDLSAIAFTVKQSHILLDRSMLKTNAELRFFETSANNDATKRRHILDDSILNLDRCENLTFRMRTDLLSTTV